jgi:hypothetical protein
VSYYQAGDYYMAGGLFSKLKKGITKVAGLATHTVVGKLITASVLGPAGASLLGAVAGGTHAGNSLPMPGTQHHTRAAQMRRTMRRRPVRRRRRY